MNSAKLHNNTNDGKKICNFEGQTWQQITSFEKKTIQTRNIIDN